MTTPMPPRPNKEQVRAFLQAQGLTGDEAARRAYLSGPGAVRKYTCGANPHMVSLAIWFVWHAYTVLDAATIAEIEDRMRADAGG